MDDALKRRLTGAVVLVSLAVIFVPMLVEEEPVLSPRIRESNIPVRPPSVMIDPDTRRPVTQSKPAATTPSLPEPEAAPPAAEPPAESKPDEPAPAVVAESESSAPAEKAPAPEPAEQAAAPPPPKEPEVVSEPTKRPSGWVIQVGSFADKSNAEKTLARLRKGGYDSFMEEVRVGSKSLYRVRVGPEVEKRRAESINTKISADLKLKGQVLRYP